MSGGGLLGFSVAEVVTRREELVRVALCGLRSEEEADAEDEIMNCNVFVLVFLAVVEGMGMGEEFSGSLVFDDGEDEIV
ncbi:hypothetical protein RJT34_01439 [Clitoria ternatea]|uniref:Uncharacterized protein n=1 Tax=Clitoria ternatea TaxID=43366 RepID=A0AAN9KJC5_CLITE